MDIQMPAYQPDYLEESMKNMGYVLGLLKALEYKDPEMLSNPETIDNFCMSLEASLKEERNIIVNGIHRQTEDDDLRLELNIRIFRLQQCLHWLLSSFSYSSNDERLNLIFDVDKLNELKGWVKDYKQYVYRMKKECYFEKL